MVEVVDGTLVVPGEAVVEVGGVVVTAAAGASVDVVAAATAVVVGSASGEAEQPASTPRHIANPASRCRRISLKLATTLNKCPAVPASAAAETSTSDPAKCHSPREARAAPTSTRLRMAIPMTKKATIDRIAGRPESAWSETTANTKGPKIAENLENTEKNP